MMKLLQFLTLLLLFWSAHSTAQQNSDSLRKIANSLMYEQPDEAISIALKLLKKEKEIDEMAHLYILISNAYIAKKNNDSSLYYNLKVENLITKTTLSTTKIKILNSVAVQYQQMELYEKALQSLDKAQKLTDKFPVTDKIFNYNSGFINNMRGIIYRNQSNPDLAVEKFRTAAEYFNKLKLDENTAANLSITYYNMASCFLDLSKLQPAFNYFKEAEKYAKVYQDIILKAYALKGQGEIYFAQKQYERSLEILYQAEKLAEPMDDLVLNEEIFTLVANNNLATDNIAQFQIYNSKSLEIQKTLEKDELRSLNRYLNAQNLEQEEFTTAVRRKFQIFSWIIFMVTLCCFIFLSKKILDVKKKNGRQRKLIERLTKSKKAV